MSGSEPAFPQTGSLQYRVRRALSVGIRRASALLPISDQDRLRLRDLIFDRFGRILSWTVTYQNWDADRQRHRAMSARIAAFRSRINSGADRRFPSYEDPSSLPRPERLLARAIAFYLPQFHTIPENDAWWGEGFTEWTNVRRARPIFQGHRQPRRPGELGYYDLLAGPAARRRQAALAQQYGIEGFCFYFYWFSGKRLLEAPIRAFADDRSISLPFCLCWANESWSRRWDGREDLTLMAQQHSAEDDLAFIRHVAEYLKSERYIRVGGRPLLIIYRPDKMPDPAASAARWRQWCRENGVGEIYLAYTLSFASGRPEDYGFDAAIEFPPNNMGLAPKPDLVTPTDDSFAAQIYDLEELALRSEFYPAADFKVFRGVTPQWDNTARRGPGASVMLDAGPWAYERWLNNAARQAQGAFSDPSERLVFINAWNEWAEGAYLEPDLDYGYAWLAATRRGLVADPDSLVEPAALVPEHLAPEAPSGKKVIIVVHDLWRNGAQIHSLHLAAAFKGRFGLEVTTIACGDGPLAPNFEWYGDLVHLPRAYSSPERIRQAIAQLSQAGYRHAIINSSAGGWLARYFDEAGISFTGLVHELPEIIRTMELEENLREIDRYAAQTVFAADFVRRRTEQFLGGPWRRPVILPQGLYKTDSLLLPSEKASAAGVIRSRLGLPENARIITGAGFGDHRKGVDIFCRWALATIRDDVRCHFIWLGELEPAMKATCEALLAASGTLSANIHFAGFRDDTALFFRAADAYALPSREDPYPSTVLEALANGTPAFVIAGTTGLVEISMPSCVRVLTDDRPETFSAALQGLLNDPAGQARARADSLQLIRSAYGFCSFAGDLLRLSGMALPRISVVIPNYNYARFLAQRISSILAQELPVWEIIFLDDASSDDSLSIAERLLKDCGIHYRIIPAPENSGSVFAQWRKGAELARGEIVWIAEADDWASSKFTQVAAAAFADEDVVLSYTQSNQVSSDSEILCPHYLDYVADIDRQRWRRPFVHDGNEELAEGLSVKNTIPNVSGVLFRRDALLGVLKDHEAEIRSYRVAGDWCVYAHLSGLGKIAFDPRPLNFHRRHAESVTISRFTRAEWDEIARMQQAVARMTELRPETVEKAAAYLAALATRL